MRTFTRLTSLAAVTALAISLPVAPASANNDEQKFTKVTADLVGLDGSAIEPQDPGIPAGDGGNAIDPGAAAPGATEQDLQSRVAVELVHALGSKDAQDMKGYEQSLYRGKWYMPKKEEIRKCIMDREANHRYRAVSAGGTYRGAYQMNRGLARGATFMMQKEVKKEMPQAVDQVKKLRKIPTQQWSRYWQDRAFWTIWRKGKGKHHWRTSYRPCF